MPKIQKTHLVQKIEMNLKTIYSNRKPFVQGQRKQVLSGSQFESEAAENLFCKSMRCKKKRDSEGFL